MATWSRFDALVRELGALRVSAARRTDVAEVVKADIDELINEAAQAVHDMIDSPDDYYKALAAWELILMAQDLVAGLRHAASETGQLVTTATHLKRRAVEAMARAALLHGKPGG